MTMHHIASNVLGADSSSWVIFNNIPQTFAHLQLRIFARNTNSNTYENLYFRPNGDTSIVYNGHTLIGDGSGVSSSSYLGYDSTEIGPVPGANNTVGVFGNMIIDFLDYSNTSKLKTIKSIGGYDNNGSGNFIFKSGLWRSTNAISQLIITYPPYRAGSRFDLYGITTNPIATGA